jgi:rfaE bifunctional protein kinase chain/domain
MSKKLIKHFGNQKILILGDLMLDEYLWGDVQRISPEAPVQVVDIQRESIAPGGAANVAVNAASLGGKVYLGGVVGRDTSAKRLRDELVKWGISLSGLVDDEHRSTITKSRLVARNQQIVRFDREVRVSFDYLVQQLLLDWIEAKLPEVSLCIFSDYAKGISTPEFMQKFMGIADRFRKLVLVDPKGNGFEKYKGASLITPNLQEMEVAVGFEIHTDNDLLVAYRIIQERLPGTNILIKLGARGMTLFHNSGESFHVESEARQVFDVTGAGDTAIATFAMMLASGANMEEATRLANRAAGIVVGKIGTASVTAEELLRVSKA